ncbi:N utilization substance protein B [Clostridia bacterium]|nr:N utilization substance protein B [Clostridia bacterium]
MVNTMDNDVNITVTNTEQTDGAAGSSRRQARAAILHLLYARGVRGVEGGFSPDDDATLRDLIEIPSDDHRVDQIRQTVRAVESLTPELDEIIARNLSSWSIDRLTRIDRLILRLAVHELLFKPDENADSAASVAIAAAIELARIYSTDEAITFINGVLGSIQRNEKPHY